ncbi:ImuA family protein [Rhodovibrionaceae bacterium A322]
MARDLMADVAQNAPGHSQVSASSALMASGAMGLSGTAMTGRDRQRGSVRTGDPVRARALLREDHASRGRRAQLAALERQVRQIERGGALEEVPVLPLGVAALDEALPGGGLPVAGLHEVLPARAEWDDGATTGFLTALLVRLLAQAKDQADSAEARQAAEGAVLWIGPYEDLYGPGLAAAGLPPERVLRVKARKDEEVLWALEEALTCPELLAVVGEVCAIDRIAARRLQLAAEAAGKPCFLLRRPRLARHQPDGASAAVSRWRITTAGHRKDGSVCEVGKASWQVDLLRCRSARPATFALEWDHETGHLDLAAELLSGPSGQPTGADLRAAEPLYA